MDRALSRAVTPFARDLDGTQDLGSHGIVGGTQDGYMASLIWTPVDYVRFMLNYARMEYKDAAIVAGTDRSYGVDVFGARTQVSF